MFKRFLPETTDFFSFFEDHSTVLTQMCNELLAMCEPGADLAVVVGSIKTLERKADDITRRCLRALQKTFITPFDRTQIKGLIGNLDDIADSIDEAASRILVFEIKELRPEVKTFAEILLKATNYLKEALDLLRNLKNEPAINQKCIAVIKLENEGDEILRQALTSLFKNGSDNPVLIIKWKEIFEHLEEGTDMAEDAANQINGIVIEAS
ncbi:MAG: DUF47 domain-containing protein [SAR324 cluster bacterium]|uniref:DUF47 domain-containing protein n=1 Tax=SAR324 cluster bacterium TaxID=2024889 RepID=A0A7X9FSE5_9DELT|nr:DUF47 domain-containing protein [SAR324 cluster bacterium]